MSLLCLHLVTESTMVSYLSESFLSSCVGVKNLTPLLWKLLLSSICPQNITSQLSDSNSGGEIELTQVFMQTIDINEELLGK